MKHRHLVHEDFTLAAIEDILDRGVWEDWEELITPIEADPHGEIAEYTRKACEHELTFDRKWFTWYGAPMFRCVLENLRNCGMSGIKTFHRPSLLPRR